MLIFTKITSFYDLARFCEQECSFAQKHPSGDQYSMGHSYVCACCVRKCQKVNFIKIPDSLAASCFFVEILWNSMEMCYLAPFGARVRFEQGKQRVWSTLGGMIFSDFTISC
jgi:hypothetical protein